MLPLSVLGLALAAEPAGFALGINEALAVPAKVRPSLDAVALQAGIDADAVATRALGATYVRGHTANFPRTSCHSLSRKPSARDEMDIWVRSLGSDLIGVAMVSPWPGNRTGNHTEHYVPRDLAAYRDCVAALVERYDGDGLDDMPGLPAPLRHWEFDNEPDIKNSRMPKDSHRHYDATTFCTPQEYAIVLRATSEAIRGADPTAKILALGLYRPHAEQGLSYGKRVLAEAGVRESFDIVSLHTYGDDDGETLARSIANFRELIPERPIWITEASVTLHGSNEAEQGRRVAAYVARAAAAGAERLFWHTLTDPPTGRNVGDVNFNTNSLLRAVDGLPPVDKPAGVVFRNLSARLAADDLRGAVLEGEGAVRAPSGAVLLFRGTRTAPFGGTDLATGDRIPPGAVAAAPAWLDPG